MCELGVGRRSIVMTDLEMPSVDGHAVVRATRKYLPQACLIVATAKATEHEEALTQAGACIVTDKPLDYEGVTKASRSVALEAVLICMEGAT